ncbi:MAG: YfiR family protein [Cytophagales bacterium]|nr:YfiR family protein [Cytophagales bacterium]
MQKRILGLLIVLLAFNITVRGQDIHKFHSIFIYNFSKFIQWPAAYKKGDFVIGVLGNSPVTRHLRSMAASKKVGSQRFSIVSYKNPGDIQRCHILYIPTEQSSMLEECKANLTGTATLIITDKPGLGKDGSGINFLIVDGKPKFELNKSAAEERNLKVSTELAKLAILI